MKKFSFLGIVLIIIFWFPGVSYVKSFEEGDKISVDDILSMESVVSGRASPKWSPNGKNLIFSSKLNGGLVSFSPDGGTLKTFPIDFSKGGRDPQYSPDGKWISYISNRSGNNEIWLWSEEDNRNIQLTILGGRVNNTVKWAPNSSWIVFSNDCEGNFDVWKVAVPSGEVYQLTSDELDEVYPTWTPDSKKILFVRLDEHRIDHDVIEVTASGESSRLVVSDKDFFDYGDYGQGWMFGFPAVSPDGENVLFRSYRSGWINYWVVPIEGGETRQIAPEEADQNHGRWSPDGKFIVYTSNHNGTHDLRMVPAAGGEPRVLVAPEMGVCADPEWSPDGKRISFTFTTPTLPKDLYVIEVKSGEKEQLTYSMPAGNFGERLVVPEKVMYKSTDGYEINAYLYKPREIGRGEKFPGIVWIHGGYKGGGNWQFDDSFLQQRNSSKQSVQFMVQYGYVVLQPNTRGSTGYGREFEKANNGRWGENELKDILAGVEYLKSLPYLDKKNIGITGRSYGGTMTMVAISKAPGVFQAAIAEAGLSDWASGINNDYPIDTIKMFEYEIGPLVGNESLYRELSPITDVENIKTPVFIVQGNGASPGALGFAKSHGFVVLPDSKLFAKSLLRHFKVFEYKEYPSSGYYVSSYESRRQFFVDRLDFFERFLKGKVAITKF